MQRVWLMIVLITSAGPAAFALDLPTNESYFLESVYPLLHAAQCNLCHNDNGVAAETSLEFPGTNASDEQITAFGLKLMDLVDLEDPEASQLLLKPTNRDEHTGEERIKVGSDEEQVLLNWIRYLAAMSDEQVEESRRKITRAERLALRPLTVRRLTHSQYNNTVEDLLGDQTKPARGFPKEDFVRGFKNQLEGQGITPLQAEAYGKAAERLAASAFRRGDPRGLIPTTASLVTDSERAREFILDFGGKAFRRPIVTVEADAYVEMFEQEVRRTNKFLDGARMVAEVMLQSPHFLFRVERGQSGPDAQYQVASRLSYFLWDTMPSEELLFAAREESLSTPEQVESIARRMLSDRRARRAMREFLAQWMRFDLVLNATRDRRTYRNYSADLAAAMVEETQQLFDHLVWHDQNFMEFYTANYSFVSSQLAELYGLPAPDEEFTRVDYPDSSGRSGVLGHGSFLVATSKPSETSPTSRGLFVRNHFLSQEVPPPPPGVNTVLPEVTEDVPMTNRQRLAIHLNSEACSGCHRLIDPIGFGFEQYDAIGRFREKISIRFQRSRYDGKRGTEPKTVDLDLDLTAHVQGIEGSSFSSPKELGEILAENEACQRCVVKQLFRYAFGREETAEDQPTIDALMVRFRDSGFRFRELIIAMVTSDLFVGM
jgi:hypothetical protein